MDHYSCASQSFAKLLCDACACGVRDNCKVEVRMYNEAGIEEFSSSAACVLIIDEFAWPLVVCTYACFDACHSDAHASVTYRSGLCSVMICMLITLAHIILAALEGRDVCVALRCTHILRTYYTVITLMRTHKE